MPRISFTLKQRNFFSVLALLGFTFILLNLTWALTAFTPGSQPIGYVAQDEVTSFDLTSDSETLFRPEYKREYWSGNLHAYPVDKSGNVNLGSERWVGGASAVISNQISTSVRYIGTMKDDGSKVPFLSASLSTAQQTALAITVNSTPFTSAQIVNYLRGDSSNEGSAALRQRASPLGDIVHSRPFFVDDGTSPTVFVGANDGMLHAINADTGAERWAYVPSMLLGKMKNLANNPYTHDYYVDGQIVVGDITVSGTSKKVLFGGLGAGGKGLYALDVSSLTATSDQAVADKLLWEITPSKINATASSSYARLGYTYGTPVLTKVKSGSSSIDVLIVGNGYDDAATGQAFIYVIKADDGTLLGKVSAGSSGVANPNGIFNLVAIDTDNDGNADRVYAGDLNGTMWKFDLSSTTPSSWPAATSLLVTSPARAITSTPGVASHPNGGYMVNFATGKMLSGDYGVYNHATSTWTTAATGDVLDSSGDFVYGIWDGAPSVNAVMLPQTITESSYTDSAGTTTRVRRITATEPTWASGAANHKGWKVALPAGERVIGEGAFIENGRFYFNSYNPTVVPLQVTGTNTDIYGENWLMELNYLTGGSSTSPFLDMNGDLLLNNSDRIKSGGLPITSPNENGIPVGKWISNGVQSQPILVQLQTLNTTFFNQNPDVIFPATTTAIRGVAGGHFDVEFYYSPTDVCSNLGGLATKAVGSVKFTYASSNTAKNITALKIVANGETVYDGVPGSKKPKDLDDLLGTAASANYKITKNYNNDISTIKITAINSGAAFNGTVTVTMKIDNNISTGYTVGHLTGGSDAAVPYTTSTTKCDTFDGTGNGTTFFGRNSSQRHIHEYDDEYDKTGLNMLNASYPGLNLSNAIASTENFKVLVMNQYLSPAISLHIGDGSYSPTSPAGYVAAKNYQTSASLDLTALPSYNLSTIGSLVMNMPVDAFGVKDWWGGTGDLRNGLHSSSPQCVYYGTVGSSGSLTASSGADLYTPVNPPADGVNGAGTAGTTSGARHNGAFTVQIIKATTPNSAVEQNVTGRPQYGYRIKQVDFYSYVLAEYTIFWHHPRKICYHDSVTKWFDGSSYGNGYPSATPNVAWNTAASMTGTGWTKNAPEDTYTSSAEASPASGSTDPKLGSFGSTGVVADSSTTVVANVTTTTINYTDGSKTIITQTRNSNGTLTIWTVNKDASGTTTSDTTVTVADAAGNIRTGGDERGLQARTGRVSWRELLRP